MPRRIIYLLEATKFIRDLSKTDQGKTYCFCKPSQKPLDPPTRILGIALFLTKLTKQLST